jgi:hypothetical protein
LKFLAHSQGTRDHSQLPVVSRAKQLSVELKME